MGKQHHRDGSADSSTPPASAPLGLEPNAETPAVEAENVPAKPELARQTEPVLCPYCKDGDGKPVRCLAKKTEALVTRYYCPSGECGYTVKVPRPRTTERIKALRENDVNFSQR